MWGLSRYFLLLATRSSLRLLPGFSHVCKLGLQLSSPRGLRFIFLCWPVLRWSSYSELPIVLPNEFSHRYQNSSFFFSFCLSAMLGVSTVAWSKIPLSRIVFTSLKLRVGACMKRSWFRFMVHGGCRGEREATSSIVHVCIARTVVGDVARRPQLHRPSYWLNLWSGGKKSTNSGV